MDTPKLDPKIEKMFLATQRSEITEHLIYHNLSQSAKDPRNSEILKLISEDELTHHNLCNTYTCQDVKPNKLKIWLYLLISRLLGLTFGLKLMEREEVEAQSVYQELSKHLPSVENIAFDEVRHEKELINLIDDDRLRYTGDVVRGMNVALVEITGALAGLTLAFQNSNLVVTTGLILGISMSLSVASTEYLATKSGSSIKSPLKSVIYAGVANIITVLFLLFPFFIFSNTFISMGFMILNAVIAIFVFSSYISVARDISIRKTFVEMTFISLGIAVLAFLVGLAAREFLDIHLV